MVSAAIQLPTQCVKWALIGRQIDRRMKLINNLLDEVAEVNAFFYSFSQSDTG
jgi:hypothetical protein